MLAVCPLITPAPRGPLLRRCVIIAILARTAPCASLGSTRELPASRLYRGFYETKTFPALPLRPCDRAATHTPGSSLGAFARHFPKDPAFTVITAARRSQFPATAFSRGWVTTLQRSRYVAARSLARPPGQSRLATARALSSELSPRWSPNPDVRFATWPQAITTAGPSPAGLRRFRAARYYHHHCSYGPMRQSRAHPRTSR